MLRALRIEYLGAIYQWPTVCNRPKTKVNRTTNMNSALCKYSGLTPLCYKTKAQAEAKQAAMKKKCQCDDPGMFSVHLWNDKGKDGKNPDATFDSNGKADLANWDFDPRPPPYNHGDGGVNFDFGWVYPNGTIHHADQYHNPDLNGDGKGDYFPKKKIRDALIFFSVVSEWQNGAPSFYQYGDFNAEVWCVQCKSKKYGK